MTHLLSGIEIKNENNDDDDDDSDIRLVAKSAIEGFDIGHDEKSQTKFINVIDNGKITIVDTPGLCDTNGPESDIANSIGL